MKKALYVAGIICILIFSAFPVMSKNSDEYIIIGEKAEIGDLVAALHLAEGLDIPLRNIRFDSDTIPSSRLYVIGGGSVNKIAKKMGYASHKFILKPVLVETIKNNNRMVTVIAGYDGSDTRSAVEVYLNSVER